jgi:diketogulonate reductase-like aldo/keto reductase
VTLEVLYASPIAVGDGSDPLREIAFSIDRLGVDEVDLYLVHWPDRDATWGSVSNFDVA